MCRKKCECTRCMLCSSEIEQKAGKGRAKLYCDDCRRLVDRAPPASPTRHSCLECKREWVHPATAGRKPKYCSAVCRQRWRDRERAATMQCTRCNADFVSATGRARFCRSCDRWRPLTGQNVPCVMCGTAFYRSASSTKKHCSRACCAASIKKTFECKHCKKVFSRRKYRKGDSRQYCSIQCYWDAYGMTGRTTARLNGNWTGNARRRCRKAGVPYDPSVTVSRVAERDAYQCQICKRQCNRKWLVGKQSRKPHMLNRTIDHIIPIVAGIYGHEWRNVQCACLECNMKKGARRLHGQLRLL